MSSQELPFVLLVSGWRHATRVGHGPIIYGALERIALAFGHNVILRHGKSPYGGVDEIAEEIGRLWGWAIDAVPAEVTIGGRFLGSARNRRMCEKFPYPKQLYAFPHATSRGTTDCIRWAKTFGIPVEEFQLT